MRPKPILVIFSILLPLTSSSSSPSAVITSSTNYVHQHDLFNLTCTLSNLVNRTTRPYLVAFEYSYARVEPYFTTFGWYAVAGGTVEWHDYYPSEFSVIPAKNPRYPAYQIVINATSLFADGIYRCSVKYTDVPVPEEFRSNQWAASYDFKSEIPVIPEVTIQHRIVEEKSQVICLCNVSVSARQNFQVGFRLERESVGEYSVNQDTAKIIWHTLSHVPGTNLFPQEVTRYPIFPVLVQTSRGIKYLEENLQCYAKLNLINTTAGSAIYYSGSGSVIGPGIFVIVISLALSIYDFLK